MKPLKAAIEAYQGRLNEKEEIIESEERMKQAVADLRVSLEQLSGMEEDMRKKEETKIAALKDRYLDSRRRGRSEELFIERKEAVREAERARELVEQEEELTNRIRKLEKDIEYVS